MEEKPKEDTNNKETKNPNSFYFFKLIIFELYNHLTI